MLSREICQELKDAGYDQKINYGDWFYDLNGDLKLCYPHVQSIRGIEQNVIKCPTAEGLRRAILSEIAAKDENGYARLEITEEFNYASVKGYNHASKFGTMMYRREYNRHRGEKEPADLDTALTDLLLMLLKENKNEYI